MTVLNPSDLFGKVKTCFSQKRYGCVIERLNMRTNEKSRRTADDGMGTEGTPRPNVVYCSIYLVKRILILVDLDFIDF